MPEPATPQQVEIVQEPPVTTVYANSTRMMYGIFDFRVLFAEQMLAAGGLKIVQVDRVAVVMSPQHTKRLVKAITEKLAEYERKFGPIPEEAEEPNAEGASHEGEEPKVDGDW